MVEIKPTDVDDRKTPKQEAFMFKLLNSSVFTKKEFEYIFKFALPKVKSSYDANLLLDYLTSAINFRKAFFPKRCRAQKKCLICRDKADLRRYYNNVTNKQLWLCKDCDRCNSLSLVEPDYVIENREIAQKQAQQQYKEQQAKVAKFNKYIDEEKEAMCDLARKNPEDSSVKIED